MENALRPWQTVTHWLIYLPMDKVSMLVALLEGSDLRAEDKGYARAFLSHLIDRSHPDIRRMTVALARRLMAIPGWREHMTVEAVHAFCTERCGIAMVVRDMKRTPTCDPEAEYYAGAAAALCQRIGLS
jgi:hypothetical protein